MIPATQSYTPAMLIGEAQNFELEMSKKLSDLSKRIHALENAMKLQVPESSSQPKTLEGRVGNLKRSVAEFEQKPPTQIQAPNTQKLMDLIYRRLTDIQRMVVNHNVIYCDQSRQGEFFTKVTAGKAVPWLTDSDSDDLIEPFIFLNCGKLRTPLALSSKTLCSIFECQDSGTYFPGTLEVFRNCTDLKNVTYDIYDPIFGYYVKILLGDFGKTSELNKAFQDQIIHCVDRKAVFSLTIKWYGHVNEIRELNFYTLMILINYWKKQSFDIYSGTSQSDLYLLTQWARLKKDGVEECFMPMERYIFQCTEPVLFKNIPKELASFIIPALVRRFVEHPTAITSSDLFTRLALLNKRGFPLNFPELIEAKIYLQRCYSSTYPGIPTPFDINQITPCDSLMNTLYQSRKQEEEIVKIYSRVALLIPKVFFSTGEKK